MDGGGTYELCLVYMNLGNSYGSHAYLEMNNTTFSNSLHYGMKLNAYDSDWANCLITSSNPASVTFSGCPDGNIYSNGCDDSVWLIYSALSQTCNYRAQ